MKMKPSQILLICGLAVLLVGCIMSICGIEPYADYVLVVGALLIIFRGGLRARERNEEKQETRDEKQETRGEK
ncbi:MAG: hypothetical protein KBS69_03490 [Bacteroidales bacterium]|nr:hypothetical protein [Candidatus Colicola caccequi]